jgi:hypothetical protein
MEDSVRIIPLEKEDAVGTLRRDTKAVAAPDEGNEEAICVDGF